ncbi:threalose-6-phosphate phosphatase, partial [Nowakowskiella sp. JEL0078]
MSSANLRALQDSFNLSDANESTLKEEEPDNNDPLFLDYKRVLVVSLHLPVVCRLSSNSRLPPAREEKFKERERERERYYASNFNYSSSKWETDHYFSKKSDFFSSGDQHSQSDKSPASNPQQISPLDIPTRTNSPPLNISLSPRQNSTAISNLTQSRSPHLVNPLELNGHMMVPNSPLGSATSLNPVRLSPSLPPIVKVLPQKSPESVVSSLTSSLNNVSVDITASKNRSDNIEWTFLPRRGHSALFAGVRSLEKYSEVLHIGWTGPTLDDEKEPIDSQHLTTEFVNNLADSLLKEKRCIPVFLDDKVALSYYDGYCKGELWPLFHYVLWDSASTSLLDEKNWEGYLLANMKFAKTIAQNYKPGDL